MFSVVPDLSCLRVRLAICQHLEDLRSDIFAKGCQLVVRQEVCRVWHDILQRHTRRHFESLLGECRRIYQTSTPLNLTPLKCTANPMPGRGANRSADTAAGQPEEDLSASGSQGAPAPPQNGAEKVPDDAPDDEVVGETAEPYDFRCKCGKDETDDGVESQEVVCCDKCSHWGHAECEGYLAQMNEEGAVYQCSVCLDGGCSAEVKFYTASVYIGPEKVRGYSRWSDERRNVQLVRERHAISVSGEPPSGALSYQLHS